MVLLTENFCSECLLEGGKISKNKNHTLKFFQQKYTTVAENMKVTFTNYVKSLENVEG